MGTRKDLKPGDLVIECSQRNERKFTQFALVIGVDYSRPTDSHHGCEERIKLMWSDPVRFDEVCDCNVILADTFLLGDEKVQSE